MNVTLGEFVIANGEDRTLQVVGEETLELQQQTQVVTPSRGAWHVAFPERAARSILLSYLVTFPPCDSLEAALWQSRQIPVSCPKGGVLIEQQGTHIITYAAAWQSGPISAKRTGVTNQFHFQFEATNPSTAALSTLAMLNPAYTANLYYITGLTGGGGTNLDGLTTTDVTVGFLADLTLSIAGVIRPLKMRLITDPNPGVTATNTDPAADALIVLPVDYNASTNAKIWTE